MNKNFVLDTNVLLHNADSISSFADNTVIVPMAVIEELDNFKRNTDELGRNARNVIRKLDALRSKGNLGEGVPMENGGVLKILRGKGSMNREDLDDAVPDNRIMRVAFNLFKDGEKVIFVSKDINARLKADALGIEAVDFEKQKVNIDDLYGGNREISVPSGKIDEFYKNKTSPMGVEGIELYPNEFVIMVDESNPKHTAMGKAFGKNQVTHLNPLFEKAWTLKPRSKEQRMAMELLLDPEIQIVTLVGQAGTGKTLLALAAGLQCILKENRYDKLLVTRPIIPFGKDIGYLPGGKDEKLGHWMQPIFDNLSYLLRHVTDGENSRSIREEVDRLQREHIVEMEALTYIRGRSIPKQYMILDEAQNLTPHEVKTVVSRAGEGTKLILTGDPYQIDSPYLDSSSNGLSYTVERLKTEKLHGHITLKKSERSELAAAAASLL